MVSLVTIYIRKGHSLYGILVHFNFTWHSCNNNNDTKVESRELPDLCHTGQWLQENPEFRGNRLKNCAKQFNFWLHNMPLWHTYTGSWAVHCCMHVQSTRVRWTDATKNCTMTICMDQRKERNATVLDSFGLGAPAYPNLHVLLTAWSEWGLQGQASQEVSSSRCLPPTAWRCEQGTICAAWPKATLKHQGTGALE